MPQETVVIVDLQYGSTGKGLLAGYLARQNEPDTVVCAWGPNAGHTFIDFQRKERFIHTMLPMGAIFLGVERIMIGPGAVINAEAMVDEIHALEQAGYSIFPKLYIHENAAVVGEVHRIAEKAFSRIGSTSKGTAEAQIQKMRRDPHGESTARFMEGSSLQAERILWQRVIDSDTYDMVMDRSVRLQVEGAQGFSLGINQRFYPYSTARECTAWQALVDCGVPASRNHITVVGTARTFPIRVANRPEGSSGGYYADQFETTFEAIGVPQEYTTVTKLPRRVFTFSHRQLAAALRANSPQYLFLNFMNYVHPDSREDFVYQVARTCKEHGTIVKWLGFGPTVQEISSVWNLKGA